MSRRWLIARFSWPSESFMKKGDAEGGCSLGETSAELERELVGVRAGISAAVDE
jgi:hypothetical protein